MRNKKIVILFSFLTVLALIAIIGSIIFSVQNVSVSCTADDAEFNAAVLEAANVKKGGSIFLVNEKEIEKRVNSAVINGKRNARVINNSGTDGVERIFPNSVLIHVEKLYEYLAAGYSGGYIIIDRYSEIIELRETVDASKIITLKFSGTPAAPALGGTFKTTGGTGAEAATVKSVLNALELNNYPESDAVSLVESIDITLSDSLLLKTRSGAEIRMFGADDLAVKLQTALEVYNDTSGQNKQPGVTITVVKDYNGYYRATAG